MSSRSNSACNRPFSPSPPCSAKKVISAARHSSSTPLPMAVERPLPREARTAARSGAAVPMAGAAGCFVAENSESGSAGRRSTPKNRSTRQTRCPRACSAAAIFAPEERETSRSGDSPPASTTMFMKTPNIGRFLTAAAGRSAPAHGRHSFISRFPPQDKGKPVWNPPVFIRGAKIKKYMQSGGVKAVWDIVYW